jgi:hypothetical protein
MDIRRSGRLSLLLVSLAAGVSSAQEASLEPCPQSEDTGDESAFLGFDRELRGVRQFLVTTVNLPGRTGSRASGVVFVCRTNDQRAVVDRRPDGTVRLRSWARPRTPAEAPSLEIARGSETVEGTGACAHRVWSFKSAAASYEISEPGCSADPVPDGVLGFLTAESAGKQSRPSCY